MSAIVKQIYDAFRAAGVADDLATEAARSIPVLDEVATKADITALQSDLDALRTELRSEMKILELRMTVRFFTGIGLAVAGVKALDFLIG